jgi:ribosome-binding factor A
MTRRSERIGEQLREEIARVLLEDVTDPRIGMVSLTRVDCAPDLSNAIVFWSTLKAESRESIDSVGIGLASAASFVRGRVARSLPLRRMPRLSFRYDPTLQQGSEMLSLLREISDDETP